jgi:hypothetical protein
MNENYSLREMVLRTLLQNPQLGPTDMTKHLDAKYNSVKAIYAKLCNEGLLLREGRGSYVLNLPSIILNILNRMESLEKSLK